MLELLLQLAEAALSTSRRDRECAIMDTGQAWAAPIRGPRRELSADAIRRLAPYCRPWRNFRGKPL